MCYTWLVQWQDWLQVTFSLRAQQRRVGQWRRQGIAPPPRWIPLFPPFACLVAIYVFIQSMVGWGYPVWLYQSQAPIDRQALDAAVVLHPNDIPLRLRRAVVEDREHHFKRAQDDLDIALAAQPNDPLPHWMMADTWFAQGRPENGIEDNARFLHLAGWNDPHAPYAILQMYIGLLRMSQIHAADESVAIALSHMSDDTWARRLLQYCAGQKSAASLLELAKAEPTPATRQDHLTEAHAYIAWRLQVLGDSKAATPEFQWVVAHGSKDLVEYDACLRNRPW
jgi:lipoprotein NlpI